MSNNNNCHSLFTAGILQKLEDSFARVVVQCTCRLVAKKQLR